MGAPMVICFDCDGKTKAVLDELLTSDDFGDYSEVIRTAIANLAILRRRIPRSGSAIINEGEVLSADGESRVKASEQVAASKGTSVGASSPQYKQSALGIPALFLRDHISSAPPTFAEMTTEPWERQAKIPLPEWIFGQYNKLLPAKVTCRALIHLLASKPNGVPLSKAAGVIAEEAAVFGDFLASLDSKHGLRRDEALQTGFPRTTVSAGLRVANSGQVRYANQFVAEATKTEVSGLPIALKLINCEGPDYLIRLTEPGWRLGSLVNPVLDKGEPEGSKKFSNEEIVLLLDHITLNVPVELYAYRTLLSAISGGANTPDKLNASLQEMDIWWQNRKPKDVVSLLNSQRSGAISRMADLELLQRDRRGTRVTYRLTNSGEEFLKRTKSVKR